jgi:hypothetical protein
MILKTAFCRESPMSGTGKKYGNVPRKNIVNETIIRPNDPASALCITNDTNGGHSVTEVMNPNAIGSKYSLLFRNVRKRLCLSGLMHLLESFPAAKSIITIASKICVAIITILLDTTSYIAAENNAVSAAAIKYASHRPDRNTATNFADCATVERLPISIGTTPGRQTEMQAMPLLNPNINADKKSISLLF